MIISTVGVADLSAEVKEESAPALQEVGKLMRSKPKLRLLVVGHTESVGSYDANLDLSTRRARAVVTFTEGRTCALPS